MNMMIMVMIKDDNGDGNCLLQVYMYTHTGLMDKKSNWFTHFVGMFLRPKDFMVNDRLN